MEKFKKIPWYPGYEASNLWNIKGIKWEMKPSLVNNYYAISIFKDKVRNREYVHRLVMLAFVWNSKLDVNHKNGIKTDNRLENLEYCTRSENIKHRYRVLALKWNFQTNHPNKWQKYWKSFNSRPIKQFSKKGIFIKNWDSATRINHELGIHTGNIIQNCRGKLKTCGGYIFKYL